jgi:hypothetical protein
MRLSDDRRWRVRVLGWVIVVGAVTVISFGGGAYTAVRTGSAVIGIASALLFGGVFALVLWRAVGPGRG